MNRLSRYYFAGLSLALHALILLLSFLAPQQLLPPLRTLPSAQSKKIVLTLAPALKPQPLADQHPFIDSNQSLPSQKPNTPTPFESERTTSSASMVQGHGDPALPTLLGPDATQLNLREARASVAQNQATAVTTAIDRPKQQTHPLDPAEAAKPRKDDAHASPSAPILTNSSQPPLLTQVEKREPSASQKKNDSPQIDDRPEATPERASDASSESTDENAPPAAFSADRRASTMQGGARIGPAASIASQESELGRYKAKLYRAIGSRWYLYVDQQKAFLEMGRVRVRFFVRADGQIDPPQPMDGSSSSILSSLSIRSIADIGAIEPFSDALREQLGAGYWEEVTFTIY